MSTVSRKFVSSIAAASVLAVSAFATMPSAQAGEWMERGVAQRHQGWRQERHRGFGGGVATGLAVAGGLAILGGLLAQQARRQAPSASGYNPDTGEFVHVRGNPDRSRTVTRINSKTGKKTVKKIPRRTPPSVSATDPRSGRTTTITGNGDGTRTTTVTDKNGKVVEQKTQKPDNRPSASSTDPKTGVTTTVVGNADGSRTVITTDAGGNVMNSQVIR